MVLIDASTRWSNVCLLSTYSMTFTRLLDQITRLKAQFFYHAIKTIRVDNAGEFTPQVLNDFCLSTRIAVEHPDAHVNTQNDLVQSLIKLL